MKKFFKWTAIILVGFIGLFVLAGLALHPVGMKKLSQTYSNIPVETITIPNDADAIAHGSHVAVIWGCTKCHGADLSGTLTGNDPSGGSIPTFATIPAANLTSGKGGIGQSYSDTDWIRAIRHGVKPDGRGILFMYTSKMSDQELGDLVAFLKQAPRVDKEYPAIRYGPIIPILPAIGIFTPEAASIDHHALHTVRPAQGATVQYGKYLSATCNGCHGNTIDNAFNKWNKEDFVRAFKTGELPDGKNFGPTMSSQTFRDLNDTELDALWLYFTSGKS